MLPNPAAAIGLSGTRVQSPALSKGAIKLLLSGFIPNRAIWVSSQSGIQIPIGIYSQSGYRVEFPIGLSGFIANQAIGVYFQSGSHFMDSNCSSGCRALFPIGLSAFIPNRAIGVYSRSGFLRCCCRLLLPLAYHQVNAKKTTFLHHFRDF